MLCPSGSFFVFYFLNFFATDEAMPMPWPRPAGGQDLLLSPTSTSCPWKGPGAAVCLELLSPVAAVPPGDLDAAVGR